MKKVITPLLLLFSSILFAQKSFEGSIKYSVRSPREKDTLQMNIDFSPGAIRVQMIEPGKMRRNQDFLLINLDSGKVYTLDFNRKSFTVHKLSERSPATEVPPVKTIAGYQAIGQLHNETGTNSIFGSILSNKTIFYTAEDLSYTVPQKYNGNFELMMIQNDKIVLGAEIHIAPRIWGFSKINEEEDDSTGKTTIFIEATEIRAKQFDGIEFRIPEGFVKNRPYSYLPPGQLDSTTTFADTTMVVMPPAVDFSDTVVTNFKKPFNKNKRNGPAKKPLSSPKQNALKPKND